MSKQILSVLEEMGYEVLAVGKKTANGPDVHVRYKNQILRVEMKKARASSRGNSCQVHAVELGRRADDLIAIEFPSGYILVEPMHDHLLACGPKGSRCFFGVR